MNIGSQGEGGSQFTEQFFQCGLALVAAHGKTHGRGEGLGVTWHIYLGDNRDAALCSVSLEFGALGLRVVLTLKACHVGGSVELRIDF